MILCDTGPLVAAFNAADRDHVRCAAFLGEYWQRLVIPSLTVTEVCHQLADPHRRGSQGLAAEFCAAIAADELRVIEATPRHQARAALRAACLTGWPYIKAVYRRGMGSAPVMC